MIGLIDSAIDIDIASLADYDHKGFNFLPIRHTIGCLSPGVPRRFVWWLVPCILVTAGCRPRPLQPTLTLVGLGPEAGLQLKRDALDDFTRTTAIRVDLVPAWGSSAEQLAETTKLLRLRSNPPDIFLIDVVWPGHLAPISWIWRPTPTAMAMRGRICRLCYRTTRSPAGWSAFRFM